MRRLLPTMRHVTGTRSRRTVGLAATAVAMVLVVSACTSQDFPNMRNVSWANVPVGRILGSTSGNIGVDAEMWGYLPCKDHRAPNPQGYTQDPFFGACLMPSQGSTPLYDSYAYYPRWTSNNANNPFGLFFANSGPCNDTSGVWCAQGTTVNHGWANKWTKFYLEFYPDDPSAAGVRLTVQCCPNEANGGAYTPTIGDVSLPRAGNPGTSALGASIANVSDANQVRLDAFQVDANPTSTTTAGIPVLSFSSSSNGASGPINSWSVPALYYGEYAVFINDLQRPQRTVVARFSLPAVTFLVLDRNKPCFGLAQPWDAGQWYNNVTLTAAQCQAMWAS